MATTEKDDVLHLKRTLQDVADQMEALARNGIKVSFDVQRTGPKQRYALSTFSATKDVLEGS